VIARVWSGETRAEDGDAYAAYLRRTGVADLRRTEGNVGVLVLRRIEAGVARFWVISLWRTMADVRRFAGADPERAVYYPEDERYLLTLRPIVDHHEVLEAPLPSP
jgi:heme-degrading monooxygenase HmoA